MKTFLILFIGLLLARNAAAQSTNIDRTLQTTVTPLKLDSPVLTLAPKPAEIKKGRFTYSGIAVQAVKAPNPLQLINPFAPAQYGSGHANVVPDGKPGKSAGVKFLAINF